MSDPRDFDPLGGDPADPYAGQLGHRLGALHPLPAAPPLPAAAIGFVRRRRRARRSMQVGGSVLVIGLVAAAVLRLGSPPGLPVPGAQVETSPRWVHLTGPDLPSALRLRDIWLQTGDLPPGPSGAAGSGVPVRPLDAMQAAGPLG